MGTESNAAAERAKAVGDLKRQLIRDAAKALFARVGIAGASVREIAKAAGYTTGAIYTYYPSKEEIYADILRDSLDVLIAESRAARAEAPAGERASAALSRMFRFYVDRPHDFDLSFYLFGGGVRPVGLTHELNQELNQQLNVLFDELTHAFVADGVTDTERAHRAAVGAGAAIFGIVLMSKSGRLTVLGEDQHALMDAQLDMIKKSVLPPA
ncbi:MAG: TetR/AcrR family transcriptional regulator [Actinophytocola sp.]|uniref:TetR/AcrR family transcriptional regulator n=1 Tax=Actinophytocola sp. TaxID=1872138 RepID=UPI003D6C6EBE